MSKRYPGGFIMKNPTAPTGGEYGTAPGVWTLEQVMNYQRAGTWPSPITPRFLFSWGKNNFGQLAQGDTVQRSVPTIIGSDSNWRSISGTLAVKSDGTLWAWGINAHGQVGNNTTINLSSPVQIGALTNWSKVTRAYAASFAIKTDGTLWAWGFNNSGQLGLGDTNSRSSPVQVGTLTNWANVSAGRKTNSAIKTDGTLWAWGSNNYGQLGQNNTVTTYSPVQIGSSTDWVSSSSGNGFNLLRKSNGSIWSVGFNYRGQLGINSRYSRSSPVQIGALTTWSKASVTGYNGFAINNSGQLWGWGINFYSGSLGDNTIIDRSSPVQIGSDTNWSNVYSSNLATIGLKTNGTLWAWGLNNSNQLGDGTTINRSSPVQIGSNINWTRVGTWSSQKYTSYGASSFATGKPLSLELWGWGAGTQIGDNITANRSSPVQIGSGIDWIQVSSGTSTIAIKANNTLWGWGFNNVGQIGDGTTTNRSSPVQIGSLTNWKQGSSAGGQSSVAVKTDGTLWTWGSNSNGQLGLGNTTNYSSPKQVGALTNWSSVSFGNNHISAIKTDNSLWVWGYGANGRLGLGNTTSYSSPKQVGSDTNWRQSSAGNNFTVAIKTDGTLWSWGYNFRGQLGLNLPYNQAKSSPTQVGALTNWASVQAGNSMVLAVKTDGTLWSWGFNNQGQLGQNNTTNYYSPKQVGSLTTWSKVGVSSDASFAIKTDGTLWSWGYNEVGQLADGFSGVTARRSSPTQIGSSSSWWFVSSGNGNTILALKQNSSIQPAITVQPTGGSVTEEGNFTFTVTATGAWGYQWYFAGAPIAGATSSSYTVTGATSANAGNYYVVVYNGNGSVTSNTVSLTVNAFQGALWSWGRSNVGQLAQNDLIARSSPVQVGADTTWSNGATTGQQFAAIVKSDGTLWTWGYNNFGNLGQNNTVNTSSPVQVGALTTWSKAACGRTHVLAIKQDGTLWAFGRGSAGQLGQSSNTADKSSPVQIGADTTWAFVNAAQNSSLAIKSNGTLWTWGQNDFGQLGTNNAGAYASLSSPTQVGSLTTWAAAYITDRHTASRKTDGTMWTWGANYSGQLGINLASSMSAYRSSPVQVGALTTWAKVGAGQKVTVGIRTDGTMWSCGQNGDGQLGLGDSLARSSPTQIGSDTNWSKVSCNGYFNFGIKTTGSVWFWGQNDWGQGGSNNLVSSNVPVQIGSNTNWGKIITCQSGSKFALGIKT